MRERQNRGNFRNSLGSSGTLWDWRCWWASLFTSLHLNRVGGSCIWVLLLTCKMAIAYCQPHYLHSISSLNKRSKQHKQGVATCTWSLHPAPATLPMKHSTHGLHRGCFYTGLLSVQQTRERQYREGWGLQKLSENCWNSQSSEVPVHGAIVYILLHLDRVGRSSTQVPWPPCKAATACSWTHYSSPIWHLIKEASRTSAITTDSWPPCLEPLQLGRSAPWTL